jgi:hypothetical protein
MLACVRGGPDPWLVGSRFHHVLQINRRPSKLLFGINKPTTVQYSTASSSSRRGGGGGNRGYLVLIGDRVDHIFFACTSRRAALDAAY